MKEKIRELEERIEADKEYIYTQLLPKIKELEKENKTLRTDSELWRHNSQTILEQNDKVWKKRIGQALPCEYEHGLNFGKVCDKRYPLDERPWCDNCKLKKQLFKTCDSVVCITEAIRKTERPSGKKEVK